MSTGGKHASSSRCEMSKVDGERDMRVDKICTYHMKGDQCQNYYINIFYDNNIFLVHINIFYDNMFLVQNIL